MTLSIIVLSYNTKELVVDCLQSIIKHYKSYLDKGLFEIILVDNASWDDTPSHVKSLKLSIKNFVIIENKENFGYSKGNNIGVTKASGNYLLFLNSDTQILDDGLIRMIDFFEKEKSIGVLGARLIKDDKSIEESAGRFYTLKNVIFTGIFGNRFLKSHYAPNGISEVDWVMGASIMVRKDLFDKLGGFDEHFFMYVEDMEFCLRVKKLGFKVYYYPDVSILHRTHGSSSRSFAVVSIYKSLLYFYKKHYGLTGYFLLKMILTFKSIIAISVGLVTNNKYLIHTYSRAIKF